MKINLKTSRAFRQAHFDKLSASQCTTSVTENNIELSEIERHFLCVSIACPYSGGRALSNCEFKTQRLLTRNRDLSFSDILGDFSENKITEMLSNHNKCLEIRRTKKVLKKFRNTNTKNEIPIAYLLWNSDIPIEKLASILKKLKWIKSKNEFINSFLSHNNKLKVRWNMDFKYELAYLFYRLKKGNYIRTINSKAYFAVIENKFTDYFDNKIKKDLLKYISFKINNDTHKYSMVIAHVENILNIITNN